MSRSRPTCGSIVREQIDAISQLLIEFVGEFVKQAEAAGDRLCRLTRICSAPSRCWSRIGCWLTCEMFLRDRDRLSDCRHRLNCCPLGSGAIAGTILPLDRAAIANELEFAEPTTNSMDATSDRDFAIEFAQALSMRGSASEPLGRGVHSLLDHGVRLREVAGSYSTGSSAMPQKKNPDALELIRGKAGKVYADATALFIGVKGLPLAYNKDMQETQEPVFAAAQQVSRMLRVATGFMGEVGSISVVCSEPRATAS